MSHSIRTRSFPAALLAVVLAALLALSACGNESDGDKDSSEQSSEQSSDSGADLDGVPDVVAEVNGEEVTKDEFAATYEIAMQQAASQSQMTGQQPDEDQVKQQTADELIDTELLMQEAKTRKITADDKDVDKRLASLAKQNQMGSAKEFLANLKKQGTTEEFVREQVKIQVVLERLVKDEAGPVKPTESQLRKIYDQGVKQAKAAAKQSGQKQQIPSFDKARPQLVQQAKSEAQTKTVQTLVDSLRKDAKIELHL